MISKYFTSKPSHRKRHRGITFLLVLSVVPFRFSSFLFKTCRQVWMICEYVCIVPGFVFSRLAPGTGSSSITTKSDKNRSREVPGRNITIWPSGKVYLFLLYPPPLFFCFSSFCTLSSFQLSPCSYSMPKAVPLRWMISVILASVSTQL